MTGEVVSINQATDEELFHAMDTAVMLPLREEYAKALAATKAVVDQRLDAATLQARLGPIWSPVWHKLESADYVLGQLKSRVTRARMVGILPGDPREAEIFKVAAP